MLKLFTREVNYYFCFFLFSSSIYLQAFQTRQREHKKWFCAPSYKKKNQQNEVFSRDHHAMHGRQPCAHMGNRFCLFKEAELSRNVIYEKKRQ